MTHLTLAATAAEAGLSKGGVLYHFGSRDDLVGAMVRRLIDRFDGELTAMRGDDNGAGSFTRAYVRATFAVAEPLDTERDDRLGAALIAAAAAEPELLVPLQEDFTSMQARVETDGLDPVRATIARLAADGLWLAELFGLGPLPPTCGPRWGPRSRACATRWPASPTPSAGDRDRGTGGPPPDGPRRQSRSFPLPGHLPAVARGQRPDPAPARLPAPAGRLRRPGRRRDGGLLRRRPALPVSGGTPG